MYDLALPLIGFVVGLLVGMTGIGGGSIMTPLLLAVGFSPLSAVGTDLVCSAFSKALGTGLYLRKGAIRRSIITYLLVGSVAGIALGGVVIALVRGAYGLDALNSVLSAGIAAILMLAGASYLFARTNGTPAGGVASVPSRWSLSAFGFAIGAAINLTSVGAGSILMPYLMRKLKSAQEMVGTDLAFGFVTTLVAGTTQVGLGDVLPVPLLLLLVGSVPGTYAGTLLNRRVHFRHLRPLLAFLIILAGASILVRFLFA